MFEGSSDMCIIEKLNLRIDAKKNRKKLKNSTADKAIEQQVVSSPFMGAERYFVYRSFHTEADTDGILTQLFALGKQVCLPRVEGDSMRAIQITSEEFESGTFHKDIFGIFEPTGNVELECDVAFVPLLLADKFGNRLGYGGGYYDRYFALHPDMLRVGLCYEGQIVPSVVVEKHDIPLDALITEKRIVFCSSRVKSFH